eukprot:s394_g11.t1
MKLPPRLVWPIPREFVWPAFECEFQWDPTCTDPSVQYHQLWDAVETSAAEACPFALRPESFGRARARQPVVVPRGASVPGKVGRPGDFQPEFFGSSFRRSQWVRQVRRLQHYARCVRNQANEGSLHAVQLWGSILRASGFVPSFAGWWKGMDVKLSGTPAQCPLVPPSATVAECMVDSMAQATRQFEDQLRKSSRQYAKLRREADPTLVFRDIRAQPNQGVELLAQSRLAVIVRVDHDDHAIVLDQAVQWNSAQPVFCAGAPLTIIHAEGDCLWVEDVSVCTVGMQVAQTKWLGCDDEIADEFLQAWRSKWMRHAEVPADRWQAILAFARDHLPPHRFSWPSMTAQDLAEVVASKHKRSAPGLDGVILSDLQKMPVTILHQFCQIFLQAERTGLWPQQMIDGRVTSLAKHETPRSAMDFRPITVFSLLYRCWGSFHSRMAIRVLDPHLPVSLFGSRAESHANQVWSKILYAIEFAYQHDIHLCGLVADIQKALNCLPRLVVFEACALLGVPSGVLLGWAGAVTRMARRFTLRDNISAPVLSCTGFAEGDGLSCLAMIVVDTLFHQWFAVYFPLGQPLTYVDDWQILCTDPSRMELMHQTLDRFVDALDLTLDRAKTYTWALDGASRHNFRQSGFTVLLGSRNLGAQVQMSKRHLNAVQMQRIDALQPLWSKLRLSLSGYPAKLRAIRSAAWPRGLHAISATTISDSSFQSLRSGAMKGLSADGAGCNPVLHLGLVEDPTTDPLFWACLQTIRTTRDCGEESVVLSALVSLVSGDPTIPTNGINSVLLSRIQVFGWHVLPSGVLQDHIGSFHLFQASFAEVVFRATWAWKFWVHDAVSHRPGLMSLVRVDPTMTRRWLRSLSSSDQALARKLLNGAHITQDCKVHCQEQGSDICPYCQCVDSRFHRFWQCERFAQVRSQLEVGILKLAPILPEAVSCYGWSLLAHTALDWLRALDAIPWPVPAPVLSGPVVHLFTDGSCLHQHDASFRLAAWSVIRACPDPNLVEGQIVASGPLPGVLQSAHRAEAFAVLQALLSVSQDCRSVMIWSDCESVVKRVRKILLGVPPKVNASHADLWRRIFDVIHSFPPGVFQITHVRSHVSLVHANDLFEEWCFFYNGLADTVALRANQDRPVSFWHFFHEHVEAVNHARSISAAVQKNLLTISQLVVQDDSVCDEGLALQGLCEPSEVPHGAWRGLQGVFFIPQPAVRWYGDALVRKLLSWFWFSLESSAEVRWISQFQLYADFMLCTGEVGPVHFDRWSDGADFPMNALVNVSFKDWSAARKSWCCRNHQRGCTRFDCHLHFSEWEVKWPGEKKDYCCKRIGMGCPKKATPVPFQCLTHFERWEKWSPPKRHYCCANYGRACDPFDCNEDFQAWKTKWSFAKKAWCCEKTKRACAARPSGYGSKPVHHGHFGVTNLEPNSHVFRRAFLLGVMNDCLNLEVVRGSKYRCLSTWSIRTVMQSRLESAQSFLVSTVMMKAALGIGKAAGAALNPCIVANTSAWLAPSTATKAILTPGLTDTEVGAESSHIGCGLRGQRSTPEVSYDSRYNCDAGFQNWQVGWSAAKKEWCCRARRRGCERQKRLLT